MELMCIKHKKISIQRFKCDGNVVLHVVNMVIPCKYVQILIMRIWKFILIYKMHHFWVKVEEEIYNYLAS